MFFYSSIILLVASIASALPHNSLDVRQTSKTSYIQFGNGCDRTVYYAVYENTSPHVTGGLLTTGSLTTQEGFRSAEIDYGVQNLGISIKASFTNPATSGPILQFEVDKNSTTDAINYDISAVNGDPFKAYGSSMYIDSESGPCYNIKCPAGNDDCAFLYPNDNSKDHSCPGIKHIVYAQVCKNL